MATTPDRLMAKDLFELYETGKHRRYTLLFAVNGGAFAVGRLWAENPDGAAAVLGGLTLPALAVGMAAFTAVMVADIFTFGEKMRRALAPDAVSPPVIEVFGPVGRIVLLLLGSLVVVGWLLVGFGGRRG
jgi:hypothetical protein